MAPAFNILIRTIDGDIAYKIVFGLILNVLEEYHKINTSDQLPTIESHFSKFTSALRRLNGGNRDPATISPAGD